MDAVLLSGRVHQDHGLHGLISGDLPGSFEAATDGFTPVLVRCHPWITRRSWITRGHGLLVTMDCT